jgi:hypothetical protein
MADAHIAADTLDDLLREVIEQIQTRGTRIFPTKGEALELPGMLLEITNPRARLSRTEMRGKLFSALGELCWYLAGTNELDFIRYYIPFYVDVADDGKIYGGYPFPSNHQKHGPRKQEASSKPCGFVFLDLCHGSVEEFRSRSGTSWPAGARE